MRGGAQLIDITR